MSETVLDEFVQRHDACMEAWRQAFRTGDASIVSQFPSSDYTGVFCYAETTGVEATDAVEATTGLQQFAAAFRGAEHRFAHRVVRARGDDEIVVSYERILENAGQEIVRFLVIQTWRSEAGQWKLRRELAEHI